MIRDVVLYGSDVLNKVAQCIPNKTDIRSLVDDMFETMAGASGCGLAAPQIGKSMRLFVAEIADDADNCRRIAVVNPVIRVHDSCQKVSGKEGCLSLPNIFATVARVDAITMSYYTENWKFVSEDFFGFHARIVLHEFDHLNGVLYLEHLLPEDRNKIKNAVAEVAKGIVQVDYKTVSL